MAPCIFRPDSVQDPEAEPPRQATASAGDVGPPPTLDNTVTYVVRKQEPMSIDETDIYNLSWWLCYCMGLGGLGFMNKPSYVSSVYNCVFCNGDCDLAYEGPCSPEGCNWDLSCCYAKSMCQCPANPGVPRCVLCDLQLCGYMGGSKPKEEAAPDLPAMDESPDDWQVFFEDYFVPLHCCCVGLAGSSEWQDYLSISQACFGFRYSISFDEPSDDDEKYCHLICRIPPRLMNNPQCACCGWRTRKPRKQPGKQQPDAV
eukprot:TRINITY_DN18115_c0_g1_i1.p1 TRINITY_DN18115_c0_g1~~TRINITY_DN18115_c0_g1_i1.p1  ORF type:complete len:258 (-),score=37.78 TRINITY_DN18115_c0_g1_i1:134-907(-)